MGRLVWLTCRVWGWRAVRAWSAWRLWSARAARAVAIGRYEALRRFNGLVLGVSAPTWREVLGADRARRQEGKGCG